jgi:hypothetical protein
MCDADQGLNDDLKIDIVVVGEDAARRWAAILATGQGWWATITRDGKTYRSPWFICLNFPQSFNLQRTAGFQNFSNERHIPPSSKEALRLLSNFCVLHNTGSQSSAALAATLTFLFLNNMTATLPLPNPYTHPIRNEMAPLVLSTTSIPPSSSMSRFEAGIVLEEGSLLPYYMTLSCD